MRLGTVAVLVALVLPSVSADWPQMGGDAAGTGHVASDARITDDLVLEVALPGVRATLSTPLVLGRAVYVATTTEPWSVANDSYNRAVEGSVDALWRIDVDSGDVTAIVDHHRILRGASSDGARIFLAHGEGVDAYTLDGTHLAGWHPAPRRAPETTLWCQPPAVDGDLVVTLCTHYEGVTRWEDGRETALAAGWYSYVVALDATTLAPLWYHHFDAPDAPGYDFANDGFRTSTEAYGGISIIGPYVFVTDGYAFTAGAGGPLAFVRDQEPRGGVGEFTIYAFSRADGSVIWTKQSGPDAKWAEHMRPSALGCRVPDWPSRVVGSRDAVYAKMDDELLWLNPAVGTTLHAERIRDEDGERSGDLGTPPILWRDRIIVPSIHTIRDFDVATREPGWTTSVRRDEPERWTQGGGLLAVGDVAYGVSTVGPLPCGADHVLVDLEGEPSLDAGAPIDRVRISAIDLATGETLWRREDRNAWPTRAPYIPSYWVGTLAGGDGFLVHAMLDGSVTILGRTAASPTLSLPLNDTHAYPPPQQVVRVDLGQGVTPGLGTAITGYRAAWGDGAVSDWQASPVLTHEYAQPCTCVARFQVRNDANQTASETFTFHVGQSPPPVPVDPALLADAASAPAAPTSMERAAAALSGPLGWALLAAILLLVVLLLVARHVRRRTRLAREMAAVDRAYRATTRDPTSALSVLAERRTHASHLLLKRKLTMDEHAALVAHIASLESTFTPAPPPLPQEITAGAVLLGKYRVVRALGEGAYGRAYLAEDARVGRQVVLKVLHAKVAEDALREARAIGGIRHPNVITLHDVEQVGDRTVLVMEYADGGSLRDRLSRGAVGFEEFHALADGLLRALEAVHEAGAVHRDVKPSNVLLTTKGEVKLADFGIATPTQVERTLSNSPREAVGTLRYMSPEQARGRAVTPRSDLYSAAVTLFEAWTGEAFVQAQPGESLVELQVRVASAGPFARDVGPRALRQWFAQALAPDADDRFASAREMRQALEAARRLAA